MAEPLPRPNSNDLKAFREALASGHPDESILGPLIPQLAAQNLLEQALLELKRHKPCILKGDPWQPLRVRMELEVQRARVRRMHLWQLDPRRRSLRLRMEVRLPACNLHPPALQAVLARALMESGLPLAMGLEKTLRPMVRLGHPLPLGVEGLSEWADAVFREPPQISMNELADHINPHCPQGLRILQVEGIPNHASPVLDLCHEAHWDWTCPVELQASAMQRLSDFAASDSYEIEKTGKVDGHKQVKRVEVRHLVQKVEWEGATFRFTTRLSAGEALNPVKLLAAVIGLEPSAIAGLKRMSVDLIEDPRLTTPEKYEPKLHNIYEDAVLLESGSHIRIIEEDEDEPIVLRKDQQER